MATDNRFKPIAVDMGGSLTSTPGGSAAGAVSGNTMLRYGSSGNDVRNLQTTLSGLGYNVGTVDGIFGNQTKNAVMQYQKDMGLSADGIVGDQTWGALSGSNKPNIPNYNDVLNGMASQNPQVSQNTVSQMTVPEVMPNAPTDPKTQSGIPNYNDVLNDLAAKNPQVSPNVVDMLRVPDMNPTGNGGTPVTDAAPTGGNNTGGNTSGGNVPTGGNTPAQTVQTPTSQDILTMYDEQSRTTETPAPNTPEPTAPAPAPSAYTPTERNPYYEPNYRRLLNEMEAYPDFSFDQNSDPLWASLAKQYRREGQRATADALGQAAGLTGGIASTAAVTAASQAGDYYGAQLSDRLQDVYNNAYQQYLDRYSRLLGLAQEYRWGTDFEEGQFTGDRSFDRGVYTDDRNFDYDQYLSDRDFKYKQETDAYNRQQSSVEEAKSRVASFISMGGDPSRLDPEIVQQSGLSPAEINQMRTYYAQQATGSVVNAGGGSSSGGGGSGTGGGGNTAADPASSTGDGDIFDELYAAGITDAARAKNYILTNYAKLYSTQGDRNEAVDYYINSYLPQVTGQAPKDTASGEDEGTGKYSDIYAEMYAAGIRNEATARDYLLRNAKGYGDSNDRSDAIDYYINTYLPDTMRKDPNSTDPDLNKGNNWIGSGRIKFDYDEDEGIYKVNGNRFNSLEKLADYLNTVPMTDAQYNQLRSSMTALLGKKLVDMFFGEV